MAVENSGGSCDYYITFIDDPIRDCVDPYVAECGDIIGALEMTPDEANIFKEIWRRAAARQGKEKAGHTSLRGAEKIHFFSKLILKKEMRIQNGNCSVRYRNYRTPKAKSSKT